MIYIFSALYVEVKDLIQTLQLKKDESIKGIEMFKKEDVILALTGVGKLQAASCVSAVLEHFDANELDYMIQFGSVASSKHSKGLYSIHKIIGNHRNYYPDMLLNIGLSETTVTCVEEVVRDPKEEVDLYDMESEGVYVACSRRLGPHQMYFLKFVSDSGERITPSMLQKEASLYTKEVVRVMDLLRNIPNERYVCTEEELQVLHQFTENLHCTKNMMDQVYQLVHYAKVSHIPYLESMKEYTEVTSKEEGKKALEEYARSIME